MTMTLRVTSQGLIYTAEVLDTCNQPLPTLTHGRTTFVIGTQGEPFHIKARVQFRNASPLARPMKPHFKVYARIDGESVGYSKLCVAADNISGGGGARPVEAVEFRGRKVKEGWKSNLTFCPPETRMIGEPGKRPLPAAESLVGTILVRFKEAENPSRISQQQIHKKGRKEERSLSQEVLHLNEGSNELSLPQQPNRGENEASTPSEELCYSLRGRDTVVLDAEDQKFFTKPSLMAGSSHVLRSSAKTGRAELKAGGKYDHVDLKCRFETAEVLLLRGILDPKVPAHLTILETARAKARMSQPASQDQRGPESSNQLLRGATSSMSAGPPERSRQPGGVENTAAKGPLPEQLSTAERDLREEGMEAERLRNVCPGREPLHGPCHETGGSSAGLSKVVGERSSQNVNPTDCARQNQTSASASRIWPAESDPGFNGPDWAAEFQGQEFLRAPWRERTRAALAAAAREGRGPLSLSSVKKRAAEMEGIHIEKRKKGAVPREKVIIDLLDENRGNDLAYMAVIEKLPARVVPLI